jgi:hypothetical protein
MLIGEQASAMKRMFGMMRIFNLGSKTELCIIEARSRRAFPSQLVFPLFRLSSLLDSFSKHRKVALDLREKTN